MPGRTTLRYGGLAGSLLLAVAAYFRGADAPWSPTMTARTILSGADGWLIPTCWLVGTLLLVAAWVLGRHQVPSVRWAWTTAALWAAPLLLVLPLGSYDVYSYACQGWSLAAGHDPYAAGVAAYQCPWLDAVAPTWRDSPAPYGPVFLLLAASTTGSSLTVSIALLRLIAVVGVVLIAACVPLLARRCDVDPARAVWLAVACPLVPIHLISGAHNDAVMIGLLVAGLVLLFHTRPHWLLAAGALIGLAGGVKATALVVLPFVVLPLRRNWWVALGAVASLALASLASGLGFGWLTALAGSSVSVQWTSPPTAVGMTAALLGLGDAAVTVTRLLGLAALLLLLVHLWTRFALRTSAHLLVARLGLSKFAKVSASEGSGAQPGEPMAVRARESASQSVGGTDAQVGAGLEGDSRLEVSMGAQSKGAAVGLAATVALAPVFHPWYLVWPLAVLAATLKRDSRWLVASCAVASVLCLPDGYNLALATKSQGAIAMTAVVVGVVVYAVRRRWRRRA